MLTPSLYRPGERPLRKDPAQSYCLPSRFYTDEDLFALEKERIFKRTWQYVCHLEDIPKPGNYVTFQLLDASLFVIRGQDGKPRAFYNVCRHRAHELLQGSGRAPIITCPYHAWTYNSQGALRTARGAEKMPSFDPSTFGLREVRLDVFLNLIFVNLDDEATPLADQVGNLEQEIRHYVPSIDRLTKAATRSWTVKCNWKIVLDNFLECNHCQPAHPAFAQLVDLETYRAEPHDFYTTLTMDGGSGSNSAYQYDKNDPTQCAAFWFLWPTLTFNMVPGPPNMALFYVRPLAPGLTLEVSDYYYESKELTDNQKARIDFGNDIVQAEDIEICESVQRGMQSPGFTQGRFVCNPDQPHISEHAVHHFQTLVAKSLGLKIED